MLRRIMTDAKPTTITKEAVFEACDQLVKCESQVTIAAVMRHMRSKSNRTISKYFHEWTKTRSAEQSSAYRLPKQATIQPAVSAANSFDSHYHSEQITALLKENAAIKNELNIVRDTCILQGKHIKSLQSTNIDIQNLYAILRKDVKAKIRQISELQETLAAVSKELERSYKSKKKSKKKKDKSKKSKKGNKAKK